MLLIRLICLDIIGESVILLIHSLCMAKSNDEYNVR